MATGLFYSWLGIVLLTFMAFNLLLGSSRGWQPSPKDEKPLVPTDETPDISRGELSALSFGAILLLVWHFPMFTAESITGLDEMVLFGSFATLILGVRGLIRFLRKKGKYNFSAPRAEYAKCLLMALAVTLIVLVVNWKLAADPVRLDSIPIEEAYSGKGSGIRFTLPARSLFPWERPLRARCPLTYDQAKNIQPGKDKARATYVEGGLRIPLLLSCGVEGY